LGGASRCLDRPLFNRNKASPSSFAGGMDIAEALSRQQPAFRLRTNFFFFWNPIYIFEGVALCKIIHALVLLLLFPSMSSFKDP